MNKVHLNLLGALLNNRFLINSVRLISILIFFISITSFVVNVYAYIPPIGIPDPGFGIDEARPSRPNPWTSEQAGYYYIDYTTGTDSGRTYGYPAAPRKTIPNPVPAGSYVEVHGTYSYASGGVINLVGNGTGGSWVANKSGPAWIVGQDSANIPVFKNAKTVVKGQYVYFDMVRFEHTLQIGSAVAGYDADYIVVRNSTLVGDQSSARTGLSIIGSSASEEVTNVVIYNNLVYNWGDISSTFDQDASGIMPQEYTSNIWVLQNTVHTTSGTGIHSGGQSGSSPAITHHIYVGGNEVYNTRQSGIWLKNGMDVIFSQNHVHDIIDTSWSPSKGIGAQYGPQRLWIIFNRVHGARYGIRVPSTNAGTWYVYVIGNVIYNIKDGDGSYSGTSSWDEAAIHLHGATYAYVIGNTIYDSPSGIYGSATVPTYYYIENNIISDINEPNGSHIWIYDQTDNAVIRNSIISQYGGTETIKWGSSTKYTLSQFQSATGKGQGCSAADPLFVDKENYNLRIQSGSPARDTALPPPDLTSNVYATFNSLYGQNIEKDIDGVSRPQGLGWDMGAYEFQGTVECTDSDGDGYGSNCAAGPDCNDNNSSVHPGAIELCNGVDDDCDNSVDEGCTPPTYRPPIGIPDPADYWNGLDPIDGSAPNPATHCPKWPSAANSKAGGDSYDCYYVDKTHASATNTNNLYGYPGKPRLTPPEGFLSAGAYVYIHAGTYTGLDSEGDRFDWYGSGTPTEPIWITGNPSIKPIFQDFLQIGVGGNTSYLIFENFEMNSGGRLEIRPTTDGHNIDHVAVRNCVLTGTNSISDRSAIAVGLSSSSDTIPNSTVTYVVIYNCTISAYGVYIDAGEDGYDQAGVYMGYHTDYLWVLDSTIYHMGADSIAGSHYANSIDRKAEHYFIGRNTLYENDENGIDLKAIRYAIISENTIYGPWNDPPYEAIILHYGMTSVGVRDSWVIFNTIYNSGNGIVTTSGENIDIVGNVIYNINHISGSYDPTNAYSQGAAIHYRNFNGMARIVDNTIYDYDTGVQIPNGVLGPGDSLQIHGNIFSNRAEPNAYEIYIAGGTAYVDINYNQVYYPGGSAAYGWGSSTQRSLIWMISNTDECDNENEGNPQFVNPPADLRLQSSSPAIDDSIEHPTVYDDFYAQYSISIEKDKDGIPRPQGPAWDIGAYEYQSGGPTCTDNDGDGYGTGSGCSGPDCNDSNASVHATISCNFNGTSCGSYTLCALNCPQPPTETCNDSTDNDCDSLVDCSDPNCSTNQSCVPCPQGQIRCNNVCITSACTADANCGDQNALTRDTCLNAGTCTASCSYAPYPACGQIITTNCDCGGTIQSTGLCCNNAWKAQATCSADLQCDDQNTLTNDTCLNGGTCSASCSNTSIQEPICSESQTTTCVTPDNCFGTRICSQGAWSSCLKDDPSCPSLGPGPTPNDLDADGVASDKDCNDADSSVRLCTGCAVCNSGRCVAGTCPTTYCSEKSGCREENYYSYPQSVANECIIQGGLGTCSYKNCIPTISLNDQRCTPQGQIIVPPQIGEEITEEQPPVQEALTIQVLAAAIIIVAIAVIMIALVLRRRR